MQSKTNEVVVLKTVGLIILGIVTGVMIAIGLQFAGLIDLHSVRLSRIEAGPAGGGFYRGAIPDFSVEPVSGNVYEYADSTWMLRGENDQLVPFHYLEGKVLFINLWATWCAPCIAEMPDIAELEATLDPQEVTVLLISTEQERIVDAFENKHDLPLYVSRAKLPAFLKGKGLPSTYIIDKKGTIRYKHAGPARWNHPSVGAFLSQLALED